MPQEYGEVLGLPSHSLEDLARSMKRDWNGRASRNAKWFINTVGANQSESEFDETGEQEVTCLIRADLDLLTWGRDPGGLRVLEIGCGIGRMTRFLAEVFGEVHAVDVSGEMIARAKRRLRGLTNVFFHETNGLDLGSFSADFFDLIFCAYVFQHVPDKAVIRSNLHDACRVLKPGGVLKFQTNGVNNAAFDQISKDTWVGDTFSESEIRHLAHQIGASLLSITGGGTQYCWAIWRKPEKNDNHATSARKPRILAVHQQGSARDAEALDHLVVLVDQLDDSAVDVNLLTLRANGTDPNGMDLTPFHAEPVWPFSDESGSRVAAPLSGHTTAQTIQIEAVLPHHIPTGTVAIDLLLRGEAIAGPVTVDLRKPRSRRPRIVSITNAADGGRDIYQLGAKSKVRVYLEGLTVTPQTGVQVLFGDRTTPPSQPIFVPGNGCHLVPAPIPADVACGPIPVRVKIDGFVSAEEMITVRNGSDPAERFLNKSVKRIQKLLYRWLPSLGKAGSEPGICP